MPAKNAWPRDGTTTEPILWMEEAIAKRLPSARARPTWLNNIHEYHVYQGIHDDKKSLSHVGSEDVIVSFRPIPFL